VVPVMKPQLSLRGEVEGTSAAAEDRALGEHGTGEERHSCVRGNNQISEHSGIALWPHGSLNGL